MNALFAEFGAPGDPPEGNCVDKCTAWLKRANEDASVDSASLLGGVLQDFMEVDSASPDSEIGRKRECVRQTLAKHGLSYCSGGFIIGTGIGTPSRTLDALLRERDFASVEQEFTRALIAVDADPAAGVTAACAILEALCKVYIHDEQLEMPSEQTIKPLWAEVQRHLGLSPASIEDNDLRRILSGLISIVDGLGAFRTHTGSVHGRGRLPYRLQPRHARLVIHSAHTLVNFVIETWDSRKRPKVSG
ncbi:MAG: abortive infection family protein [Verrucomicrobia bacterium]|nr:abortive infection family protein [Verrucomicrobiota bacterium]